MKILYLEDNSIDIDLTKRALFKAIPQIDLKIARTISEAEKFLKTTKDFDLILLDLNLPDGNGMDLLLKVREMQFPIAIVILTGENDEEIAITALKAGADDYLTKSIGYLNKLPEIINQANKNFSKIQHYQSKVIKVLYLERNKSDVEFTKRHFKKFAPNLQIKAINTSKELLEILPATNKNSIEFDILLMDYNLEGLNGIELTKIVKRERKLNIPIIIVTGQGNEDVAVQALKFGADDYLVKRENYLARLPSILLNAFQRIQLEKKQQELENSREEYKRFFEDDLTGDFVATIEGNLLNCNPAYLKICGFSSKEEALNYDINNLYLNPEERQGFIKRLKNGEKAISYEVEIIRLDGNVAHLIGNMIGIYNNAGELDKIRGYIFDDTQRKRAVNELRKISVAVEQSPATVLITDLKGNIEYVNKKFEDITGYTLKEVKGKNPRIFNSGNQPKELYETLWETITAGDDWFGEFLNKKKDGSLFWEQATISSIKDKNGNITNFIGVKEDITEKKNNEIKLLFALEKAKESDRLKSAFLANMSHEIRTPMNGILGFSDLLKSPNLTGETQKKYIEIIEKSGIRMLNTINDIINISKIESGQMPISISEFNINKQLDELYDFFIVEAERKGIQLLISKTINDNQAVIKSDPEKTYAILLNLIKNAIKFTSQGTIEFGCFINGNQLEFYVSDTGIGIPVERQPFVFDRFVQADIEDKSLYGGSGLGLTISKSYVEMLGGKIWLLSSAGVGSKFSFTIPYNGNNKEKPQINSQINLNAQGLKKLQLKILIVEDDLATKLYLKELLSDVSSEIILVENGLEALTICKENKDLDLILMDIRIPGMNGYEVTREVRQFNKDVIIIAQTAFALSGDKEKALEAGCTDYISKPINQNELFGLILKYLKK